MRTSSDKFPPLPRRRDGDREALDAGAEVPEGRQPAGLRTSVVDCALYENGRRREGALALEDALEQAGACESGFVWIGLHDPSAETVETVGRQFGLHPLAVEDAAHAHQRPKLDTHDDSLFAVLKTARYVDADELVEVGEILIFLGPRYAITVRHGAGSPLAPVRRDLEAHPDLLGLGPSAVLYAVADRVVDDYADVIDGVVNDIDEVEAQVFSGGRVNSAQRIYRLKREILEFKRAITPLAGPMDRLAQGSDTPVDPRIRDYLRDVEDHLTRDIERVNGFNELLTGVLQANLAQVSLADNEDMRKISAWVAVIAVPTMVFGLYGMNFRFMPELRWEYGYPLVMVVTIAVCVSLWARFKRVGWL